MTSIVSTALLVSLLSIAAGGVVLYRALHVIAVLHFSCFDGGLFRFVCIAVYWSLFGGGGAAVMLGKSWIGGPMLLIGIALMVLTDRRKIG